MISALSALQSADLAKDSLDWLARFLALSTLATGLWTFAVRRLRRRTVTEFFGGSTVTAYFPLRELGGRRVIAEPDFEAATQLSAFLGRYGVTSHYRFITDEKNVDLSAPGLVVICGPKTSPLVAATMSQDPCLRFEERDGHWVIRDLEENAVYRSPRDTAGLPEDIGYVSRVRRVPHLEETFLSIAGIHAEGSAIAIRHLCHLPTLKKLKKHTSAGGFSAVFSGQYSANPLEIQATEQVIVHPHGEQRSRPPRFVVTETLPREDGR